MFDDYLLFNYYYAFIFVVNKFDFTMARFYYVNQRILL